MINFGTRNSINELFQTVNWWNLASESIMYEFYSINGLLLAQTLSESKAFRTRQIKLEQPPDNEDASRIAPSKWDWYMSSWKKNIYLAIT